ncbi:MAG: hypothetical protein WCP35_06610 [Verrucomicrobiota bacterium]
MVTPRKSLKLPAHFEIEPELREQLSNRAGHQRCLEGRDELLLVVHDVPQAGVPEREAWFFWKRHDGRWAQPGGSGLGELGELLERYAEAIDDHEDRLDKAAGAAEICVVLRHAPPLARCTRNLMVALEQTLAADPENREIRTYRDRARELERAAELLNTDARVALECWQAERVGEQSQASRRLGILAFRMCLLAGFSLPLLVISNLSVTLVGGAAFIQPLSWGMFFGGSAVGTMTLWLVARHTRKTCVENRKATD